LSSAHEVLARSINQEKEIKAIQLGKELKSSLFADDRILFVEQGLKNIVKSLGMVVNACNLRYMVDRNGRIAI
jgi:hypothetical protein